MLRSEGGERRAPTTQALACRVTTAEVTAPSCGCELRQKSLGLWTQPAESLYSKSGYNEAMLRRVALLLLPFGHHCTRRISPGSS